MDLHKIIMPQDVRSLPANVAKILVLNKWDLLPAMSESLLAACFELGFKFVLPVSCQSGEGVPGLLDALGTLLAGSDSLRTASANEVALITRERHRYHVEACCGHMRTFLAKVRASQGQMDILSEELRLGAMELGAITGSIGVEEVLDVIFRDFCIGK
jgi:tRNA modification GTPase